LTGKGYDVPIAFITAQDDRDGRMRAKALQAGALVLLPKPFSDEQLVTVIKSAVGN
jgi:FixJ family two-component response regulator